MKVEEGALLVVYVYLTIKLKHCTLFLFRFFFNLVTERFILRYMFGLDF